MSEIKRFKVGFGSDYEADWGGSCSIPTLLTYPNGVAVLYRDHTAAITAERDRLAADISATRESHAKILRGLRDICGLDNWPKIDGLFVDGALVCVRRHVSALTAERDRLRREIEYAAHKTIPKKYQVRVCEGGAEEDVPASLSVSLLKFAEAHKALTAENARLREALTNSESALHTATVAKGMDFDNAADCPQATKSLFRAAISTLRIIRAAVNPEAKP